LEFVKAYIAVREEKAGRVAGTAPCEATPMVPEGADEVRMSRILQPVISDLIRDPEM